MLMNVKIPTSSTIQQHDFPRHPIEAVHSVMDEAHLFSHPLNYLHARLQAFTILGNSTALKTPLEIPGPSDSSINDDGEVEDIEEDKIEIQPAPRPMSLDSRRTSSRLLPSTATTTFQIAHPPPSSKTQQRFSVRAKPLLQLRQMSAHRSPRPVADILSMANVTPNLAKLMSRTRGARRGARRGDGRDDLVMVNCGTFTRASEAERSDGEESKEERGKVREVAAVIYNVGRMDDPSIRSAEICIGQGLSWIASVLPGNAGYEFIAMDEHGVQVRAKWIPTKRSKYRRTQTTAISEIPERRYRFSVLTAGVRRHPIIGYIDRNCISVCDQYVLPTTPPIAQVDDDESLVALTPSTPLDAYFDRARPAESELVDTDSQLRTLVLATGIWVALVEGWSDAFKYTDTSANTTSPTAPTHVSPQLRALRSTSVNFTSTNSTNDITLPSPRIRHPSLPPLNTTAISSPRTFSRLGSLPQRARSFATRHRNSFASSDRPSTNDLAIAAAGSQSSSPPVSRRGDAREASATSLASRVSDDVATRLRSEDGGSVRESGSWMETPPGSVRDVTGLERESKELGVESGPPKRIRRMLRFMNRKAL